MKPNAIRRLRTLREQLGVPRQIVERSYDVGGEVWYDGEEGKVVRVDSVLSKRTRFRTQSLTIRIGSRTLTGIIPGEDPALGAMSRAATRTRRWYGAWAAATA